MRSVGCCPFQQRWFYYSAAWQLIEEHVHTQGLELGEEPLPDTNHVLQEFFGVRYVDDVCLRRVRLPSGTSGHGPAPNQWVWADPAPTDWDYYHLTDAQFSSVAMLPAAVKSPVFERVRYDAYGRATHRLAGDLDHDGDVDAYDPGWLNHPDFDGSIGDADYEPDHDTNRDGEVDDEFVSTYYDHNGRTGVPDLRISDASTDHPAGPGPDNAYGYCGYVFSSENALYCVRFRWYDPVTGRWLQRDPAGYVDGASLHEYVVSNPCWYLDPYGLSPQDSPQWHHLFPDAVFKKCSTFDYEKAEYGQIFMPGDHKWDKLHMEWNAEWKKWIKELEEAGIALTEDLSKAKLSELMNDKRFIEWLSKGSPASMCKGVWDALSSAEKKLAADAAHAAAAAARKELAERLAAKILKRTGKTIGKLTIVLPVAFILSDYLLTDKAFAICVFDNANPLPIEAADVQAAIDAGRNAFSDYVDEGSKNIRAKMIKGTTVKNSIPAADPLPGECGCGK